MSTISKLVNLGAAGAGGEAFWLKVDHATNNEEGQLYSVAVDGDNTIYAAGDGYWAALNHRHFIVTKTDTNGQTVWNKGYTTSNAEEAKARSIAISSSGNNIFVFGNNGAGSPSRAFHILRLATNGNTTAQQLIGNRDEQGFGVALNSLGRPYMVGQETESRSGFSEGFVTHWSDGLSTEYFQRSVGKGAGTSGSQSQFRDIVIDSNDYAYVIGYNNIGLTYTSPYIAQVTSSGAFGWEKRITGPSADQYARAADIDSSDHIYVLNEDRTGTYGSYDISVCKMNASDGSFDLTVKLGSSSTDQPADIAVDDDGNMYIIGWRYTNSTDRNDIFLIRIDANGSLGWALRVKISGGNDFGEGIALDNNGNVVFCGHSQGGSYGAAGGNVVIVGKLPNDGSITGTFGNFTISDDSSNWSVTTSTSFISSTDNRTKYDANLNSVSNSTVNLTATNPSTIGTTTETLS